MSNTNPKEHGPRAVLCFSGGLDSTVLLSLLGEERYDVYALSVDYGQRHEKELIQARCVTNRVGVKEHRLVDLTAACWLLAGSCLTGDALVPEGHYTDESMKATVVPNRNAILLSLATAWAVSLKAQVVAYAAHAGDHAIYPDCRPEFVRHMAYAIEQCDWSAPKLYTPFINRSKADIVRLGNDIGAPMELSYSCYRGGEKHCGKCGTCVERKEAFTLAGVDDPTEYEDDTTVEQRLNSIVTDLK
jgi:7-cyano-7-deazaguanine synthase